MKRLIGFILLLAFALGCGNSSDNSPNTGVSSNPNFLKGQVSFADGAPVVSAVVSFIHTTDTILDITDEAGEFKVEVEEVVSYKFSVTYKDSVLYSDDSFVVSSFDEDYELQVEALAVDFEESFLDDTISTTDVSMRDVVFLDSTDNSFFLNSLDRIEDTYVKYLLEDIADETADELINTLKFSQVSATYLGHQDSETNCRYLAKLTDISQYDGIEYEKVEIHYFSNMGQNSYSATGTLKLYQCTKDWDVTEVDATNSAEDDTWGIVGLGIGSDVEETPFFESVLSEVQDIVEIENATGLVNRTRVTVDITAAFKEWQEDTDKNFGFIMTYDEENLGGTSNLFTLVSSEDSYLHPTLHFIN